MSAPRILCHLRRQVIRLRLAATAPLRRRQVDIWSSQGRAPCMVLFYHRVADEHPNDWTISNAGFRRHLDVLADHFEFVSLKELQRRMRADDSPRPAVHLTFDDGYADNCREALPLLIERQIPCTYFVTLQNILSGEPFPHDIAAGCPLAPNTSEQIQALAASGIDIGGHSMTHPDFGGIDDDKRLAFEIDESTSRLADLVGRPIDYFAFPFGLPANITERAIRAVHAAGLKGFCSAFGGYNRPGHDPFHIRRFHGDPDLLRIRNWSTIEPRWLRKETPIYYSLPPRPQPLAPPGRERARGNDDESASRLSIR